MRLLCKLRNLLIRSYLSLLKQVFILHPKRNLRVYSHDHSKLTMWTLRTIDVHWHSAVYWDRVRHSLRRTFSDWYKTTVEPVGHWGTWCIERWLCDSVVEKRELELENIAWRCSDVVGREGKGFVLVKGADDDGMDNSGFSSSLSWNTLKERASR